MSKEVSEHISEHDDEQSGSVDDENNTLGLPLEVEMNDRYMELVEDGMVRHAMQLVVMDQDGAVHAEKTIHKLKSWFDGSLDGGFSTFQRSRLRILNFLNSLWLAGCESLSQEYWWVNRATIMKLLFVSMISQACSMREFAKAQPNKEQIPQCLVYIYDYIVNECAFDTFSELNEEYLALLEDHADWCNVYMKTFKSGKKSRSREHKERERRRKH